MLPYHNLPNLKGASHLWEFVGWLAGKTVGAKVLAIKKEHERQGLIWQGGCLLWQLLKGIEEIRPVKSFCNKRSPVIIQILQDLNKGLSRTSGLDISLSCIFLRHHRIYFTKWCMQFTSSLVQNTESSRWRHLDPSSGSTTWSYTCNSQTFHKK